MPRALGPSAHDLQQSRGNRRCGRPGRGAPGGAPSECLCSASAADGLPGAGCGGSAGAPRSRRA
eukprot:4622589-Pyramimonas_sp.AAC.1